MKPLIIIFAVLTEPPGSILDTPWDYVTPLEVIEELPLENIERKLRHEELRQRYRIMENRDANR